MWFPSSLCSTYGRVSHSASAPAPRSGWQTQVVSTSLRDRVPSGSGDDAIYDGFVEWAADRGLSLYPAQDEAVIEIVSGANVILSTPTGTGKSLVAVAAHAACLARGGRTLLHGADQGAREREVLRPRRHLRRRERRHGDGRLVGEPRRADHLLHGRDPREPRPAPGRRRRRRPGRDGRVPLLRRPRPRLGVAGAAAAAAARAVRAHVGDARRRDRHRRRPRRGAPAATTARDHGRRAPGAAALLLRHDARARDRRGAAARPARRRSTSCTSRRPRRWSARRRCRAIRIVSREQRDAIAEAIGGFRFTTGVRRDPVALRPRRHRRAPRGMLPALPPARRDARPARAAARHLRHRHPRRRHQRADPHRADHRAHEVRRAADAAAQRPRVPPDRGPRGPRRATTPPGTVVVDGARARDRERRRRSRRPATTRRSSARSCARRRRRGS